MSSGASLASALEFLEDVTSAGSVPTEATRKTVALLKNSTARVESALQNTSGVMVIITVEMGPMKQAAGLASLTSMSVLMPSALSDQSAAMVDLTARISRMKQTVLQMQAST